MKKYECGIQLYTLRNELAKDFEGTLKAVAEMGYTHVEFAGIYAGKSGAEVKALLDKYGLTCITVHHNADQLLEGGQQLMDFFKSFGAEYYTIPHIHVSNFETEEKRAALLEKFRKVAKLVKDNGMKLQYHNHDFEFGTLPDGTYYLDWLFAEMPEIMPQLDICWVRYGGEDPAKYIGKYADRMATIHLKDFFCEAGERGTVYELIGVEKAEYNKNTFVYRPLGRGLQDFDSVFAALDKTDIKYLIVEQDACDGANDTPMDVARISREYLRSRGL